MGIWEVGHGWGSRGVLETEHRLQKTDKEREDGGCIAGYEANKCRELRVRRRGLVGRFRRQGMNVPVGGCRKQITAFRRERKREREKVAVGPGSR